MTEAETSALLLAEQLADNEGCVDLRTHALDDETITTLRGLSKAEKDLLWFPYAYRIQFYPPGRERVRKLRYHQHSMGVAKRHNLSIYEKGILIRFVNVPATSGLKFMPHEEVARSEYPTHVIESAYRSLRMKGLAHSNTKGLVLEPEGIGVATGVHLLMLQERYSNVELPAGEEKREQGRPAVRSPFENAIFPWFESLTNSWQPPPTEMSDAEEKALNRLILGGFVETKIEVTIVLIEGSAPISATWRVSGPYYDTLKSEVMEFAYVRGFKDKHVRFKYKFDSLRLTAEGEQAKADFRGEHDFEKPPGTTTGMPSFLFHSISGGPDGSHGITGNLVVKRESEVTMRTEETKGEGKADAKTDDISKLEVQGAFSGSFRSEITEISSSLQKGKKRSVVKRRRGLIGHVVGHQETTEEFDGITEVITQKTGKWSRSTKFSVAMIAVLGAAAVVTTITAIVNHFSGPKGENRSGTTQPAKSPGIDPDATPIRSTSPSGKADETIEFVKLVQEFMPKEGESPSWDSGTERSLPIRWDDDTDQYYSIRHGSVSISVEGNPVFEAFRRGSVVPGEWKLTFGSDGSMAAPGGDLLLTAESEIYEDTISPLREALKNYIVFELEHDGSAAFFLAKIHMSSYAPFYILCRWEGNRAWSASVDLLPWSDQKAAPLVKAYQDFLVQEAHDPASQATTDLHLLLVEKSPEETLTRILRPTKSP
jgi:hypothetical protein